MDKCIEGSNTAQILTRMVYMVKVKLVILCTAFTFWMGCSQTSNSSVKLVWHAQHHPSISILMNISFQEQYHKIKELAISNLYTSYIKEQEYILFEIEEQAAASIFESAIPKISSKGQRIEIHLTGTVFYADTTFQLGKYVNNTFGSLGIVTGRTYTKAELMAFESSINNSAFENYLAHIFSQPNHPWTIVVNQYVSVHDKGYEVQINPMQLDSLQKVFYDTWLENNEPFKYSTEQIEAYATIGGAPMLDGQTTPIGTTFNSQDAIASLLALEVDGYGVPYDVISYSIKN